MSIPVKTSDSSSFEDERKSSDVSTGAQTRSRKKIATSNAAREKTIQKKASHTHKERTSSTQVATDNLASAIGKLTITDKSAPLKMKAAQTEPPASARTHAIGIKVTGIKAEIQIDDHLTWLKIFLRDKKPKASAVQGIIDKGREAIRAQPTPLSEPFSTLLKAIELYETCSKVEGFEKKQMAPHELLSIALFIMEEIPRINLVTNRVLSRKETGLTRALQYDHETRMIYLSSRHKVSVITGEGTYKKVVTAVELPLRNLKSKPKVLIRAFTKVKSGDDFITKVDASRVIDEMELNKQFKGKTGLVPIFSVAVYTVFYHDGEKVIEIPRVSAIYTSFQGDLKEVFDDPTLWTMKQKLQAMKYIIYGLYNIHLKSMLHADLKSSNVYFNIVDEKTGELEAAIGDYGFLSKVENKKPVEKKTLMDQQSYYNQGYYGSILYTAPELFGVKDFAGDHGKIEAFALSVMMEQLLTGKNPKFAEIIDDSYEKNFERDQAKSGYLAHRDQKKLASDQKQVKELVEISRDALFEKLQKKIDKKQPLSDTEQYQYLMAALGHSNPEKRISIAQAKTIIDTFLPKVKPTRVES